MDKGHLITVNINSETTCMLPKCIKYYFAITLCAAALKQEVSLINLYSTVKQYVLQPEAFR